MKICFIRAAVLGMVAFSLLATSGAEAENARPNILFIAVDDLRPSLGCYEDKHAITPNIDRLAKEGVQFNHAYCQVAVCNPSRASLMTGLRPDKLGVWTLPIHFREAKPDAVTLPQWFRKFGYTAVSHGKIYHNPTPDPQSWSEPIRPLRNIARGYPKNVPADIRKVQVGLPANDWRKNNLRGPATAAPEIEDNLLFDGARTDFAIEDLRRLGKKKSPFFLAMGYIRPHLAWIAPKKYWDLHDPDKLPVMTEGKMTPNTPPYALSNSYEMTHYMDLIDFPKPWDRKRVSEEQARHLMHGYYACVSYVDAQIGRLLDALKEEGLAKNTIVVLWSDHGWKLGEFNGWGKMTNYEIDTRVPLIISVPGMSTAGQSTESLAELLDLFPTLCDLAKIEQPDFVDGTSLMPVLSDPKVTVNEAAYSQYYRNHEGEPYMGYAMRTSTHRFVEWRDFNTGTVTARELYDHRKNSTESENLIDEVSKTLVDELTAQLLKLHPRRPLSLTPSVHSNPSPGRYKVPISFVNQSKSEIMVYPISTRGRRGRARVLESGQTIKINARIGGVYVVESRDGTIHQIHSPTFPEKVIAIN